MVGSRFLMLVLYVQHSGSVGNLEGLRKGAQSGLGGSLEKYVLNRYRTKSGLLMCSSYTASHGVRTEDK